VGSSRIGETLQLLKVFVDMNRVIRTLARCSHQERTFDRRLNINQLADDVLLES